MQDLRSQHDRPSRGCTLASLARTYCRRGGMEPRLERPSLSPVLSLARNLLLSLSRAVAARHLPSLSWCSGGGSSHLRHSKKNAHSPWSSTFSRHGRNQHGRGVHLVEAWQLRHLLRLSRSNAATHAINPDACKRARFDLFSAVCAIDCFLIRRPLHNIYNLYNVNYFDLVFKTHTHTHTRARTHARTHAQPSQKVVSYAVNIWIFS